MVSQLTKQIEPEMIYPVSDGEPLDVYEPITDGRSEPLQLRVQIEDTILGFYREDTGEKLLIPDELAAALERETEQRQQAEARAEAAEARAMQVEQGQQTAATRLLSMGLSIEQVSEALALSLDEVTAIASKPAS